jgi:hypothetical protein
MPDAVALDGPFECPGDMLLPNELVKRLRPIAAGDYHILAASGAIGRRWRRVFHSEL